MAIIKAKLVTTAYAAATCIATSRHGLTVGREPQYLLGLPAVQHVPQPDGAVPGRAGQD